MDSNIIEFVNQMTPKLMYLATPLAVLASTTIPADQGK